ncbi:MAG: response regulator [Anaerolineae bacterium]|nr:response regulator [Anaerolineae bacterium]
MLDIIAWLQSVERLASDLYADAAVFFQDDEALSAFLKRLSQDEAWHLHLVGSAGHYLRDNQLSLAPGVELTAEIQAQIEMPLRRASDLLSNRALSKTELLELLIEAEFSELNGIFLYVINSLQAYSKRFQRIAAVVQQHEQTIESFVRALPGGEQLLERVNKLPLIWETRFLVVESDEAIRNLLRRLLSKQGTAKAVANGEEGLAQIADQVFDVIFSDAKLPDMDGIDFYWQAVSRDPDLRERFVLCLGYIEDKQWEFVQRHGIPYVNKPFNLTHVMQVVNGVLERAAQYEEPGVRPDVWHRAAGAATDDLIQG